LAQAQLVYDLAAKRVVPAIAGCERPLGCDKLGRGGRRDAPAALETAFAWNIANSGRRSENERRADKRLREEGKAVHDVHVDLRKGTVHVDGKHARTHFEALKQHLRRGL
jgi:hypothetical protein